VARRSSGAASLPGQLPDHTASDILHELSMYKEFGVITLTEDEIAAITRRSEPVRRLARDHQHPPRMALKGGRSASRPWSSCRW
jgi:hypothetical protein